MTTEQIVSNVEAAVKFLWKKRDECVYVAPAFRKLENAKNHIEKEIALLLADDGLDSEGGAR